MRKAEKFQSRYKLVALVCVVFMLTISSVAKAEGSVMTENSLMFNPFFYLMAFIIFIFIIIIMVLGKVLVVVAKNSLTKNNSAVKIVSLILLASYMLIPGVSHAQTQESGPIAQNYFGISPDVFFLMATVIIIEVIITLVLLNSLSKFFKSQFAEEVVAKKETQPWLIRKLVDLPPMEAEESLLTDHVYDGIRELDNGMPPWLKYMFGATIIFAVVYLFNYHVFKSAPLQLEEYKKELADADIKMQEYRSKAANNIDETNAVLLTDEASLKEGMNIFKSNCTACHGQLGEGGVGPNFTDDYWIHGGNIKDLFKTIKYGVVEKGMKSWQAEIAPKQIEQVASYIKSLHGTNPPNQKDRQGDLYIENPAPDSSSKANPGNSQDTLKLSLAK